jgi:antitoxin HicB
MKNLEYFMALPYRIEIQPIPDSKGGGYEASIPLLGKYAVRADGETIEEALEGLQAIKQETLGSYLEEGLVIPEPEPDEEDYSGKFVVRMAKSLHRELVLRAKENGVSLNLFVSSLLASRLQCDTCFSELDNLKQEVRYLRHRVYDLRYKVQRVQRGASEHQISTYNPENVAA